jgi:hypothetical protein
MSGEGTLRLADEHMPPERDRVVPDGELPPIEQDADYRRHGQQSQAGRAAKPLPVQQPGRRPDDGDHQADVGNIGESVRTGLEALLGDEADDRCEGQEKPG